jgi:hypothetical protein
MPRPVVVLALAALCVALYALVVAPALRHAQLAAYRALGVPVCLVALPAVQKDCLPGVWSVSLQLACPDGTQATKLFKFKNHVRTMTAWGVEITYPGGLRFRQEQDGDACIYQQYRRTYQDGLGTTLWYPHRPLEAVTRWPGRLCHLQHDRAIARAALTCASSMHWHERWGPDAQVVVAPGTSRTSVPGGHGGARVCADCLPTGAFAAATFADGTKQTLYGNGTSVVVEPDGTVRSSTNVGASGTCSRRRFTRYPNGDSFAEVGGGPAPQRRPCSGWWSLALLLVQRAAGEPLGQCSNCVARPPGPLPPQVERVACAAGASLAPEETYSMQTARAADGSTTTITTSYLPGRQAEGLLTVTTYPDGVTSTASSSGTRVAELPGSGMVISYVSAAEPS